MFSSSTLTAAFQAPRTLGERNENKIRRRLVLVVLVAFVVRVIKMRRATTLRIPKALRAMKNDI